mmetsp:Transcript_347/g.564  ORF Transcript_347/g.564 Transcript_347/m.564 type:complete len:386 (-) Transcript_347:46-1203(-)
MAAPAVLAPAARPGAAVALARGGSRPKAPALAGPRALNRRRPRRFEADRQGASARFLTAVGAATPSTSASSGGDAWKDLVDFDTFRWNGYSINYAVNKSRNPEALDVLLVHGFGASIGHFKKNIAELVAKGYNVHAIDLLGFGESEKPLDYSYTMEGWRDLLVSYVEEVALAPKGLVIAGNSIGSLATLLTAEALVGGPLQSRLKGVVLLNCAGGMNNAATLDDDWRVKLAYPIFALINALLSIKPVAQFLFDKIRDETFIENVLRSVYGNQDSVDQDLVDLILGPSFKPGALEAFVSILTGPPGPRPESAMPAIEAAGVPILILWGEEDPFTPMDGPVGKFFLDTLEPRSSAVTKRILPGTGHCPHDDRPEEVHEALLPWLAQL